MQRATVDLPEPDSPTTPSVSPRRTCRFTRLTASTTRRFSKKPPDTYVFVSFSACSTTGVAVIGSRAGGERLGTERISMRV